MSTRTMTRKELIERTKVKLDEWDATLARLEAAATDKRSEVETELHAKLVATRKSLDDAQQRWKVRRDTAQEVWETMSDEFGEAWEANRKALQRSVDELTAAIESRSS